MGKPVRIETNVGYADEASGGSSKWPARNYVADGRGLATGVHIEIEDFFPHRDKKAEMALLAGIFLGYLEFDGLIGFFEAAEERRDWFAGLEINRSMFDLDDYVACKFSVEGMKDVVGGSSAVIFGVAPIEMMVV